MLYSVGKVLRIYYIRRIHCIQRMIYIRSRRRPPPAEAHSTVSSTRRWPTPLHNATRLTAGPLFLPYAVRLIFTNQI